MNRRKKPNADLRSHYTIFYQVGLIATLTVLLAATKIDMRPEQKDVNLTQEQEVVQMEEIIQTKHQEKPPPPPRPPVPVEVPNDEILEDQIIDIDAEIDLAARLNCHRPQKRRK